MKNPYLYDVDGYPKPSAAAGNDKVGFDALDGCFRDVAGLKEGDPIKAGRFLSDNAAAELLGASKIEMTEWREDYECATERTADAADWE